MSLGGEISDPEVLKEEEDEKARERFNEMIRMVKSDYNYYLERRVTFEDGFNHAIKSLEEAKKGGNERDIKFYQEHFDTSKLFLEEADKIKKECWPDK